MKEFKIEKYEYKIQIYVPYSPAFITAIKKSEVYGVVLSVVGNWTKISLNPLSKLLKIFMEKKLTFAKQSK